MIFGRKKNLQVDLGDLKKEQEMLSDYLKSNLKIEITLGNGKLLPDPKTVSAKELQRQITKFIYKRNLNNKYYASLSDHEVKINQFKSGKKLEKKRKNPLPPKMAHGF